MAEVSDSEESSDNEEVLYHRSDEDVSSENEEPETSTRCVTNNAGLLES